MTAKTLDTLRTTTRRLPLLPLLPLLVLICTVYGCAIYANLSLAVRHSADYRFFPPFKRHVNGNHNRDLAAENFNIARSIVDGKGFSHPFMAQTGATAWMPPVLPGILAGLLWVCDGNRDAVMAVVVFLQANVLIGTGLLVALLVRQTTQHIGIDLAVIVVLVEILRNFTFWFQMTQDCWLVLLGLDLLMAGFCWWQPLHSRKAAAGWGLLGALCALISPLVGFTWGLLTIVLGVRSRAWSRLTIAVLVAGLTLAPWTIRNYLRFGRLIPIKSNLAYELYQSQCLLPDGLLQRATFQRHPYRGINPEGQEYAHLGEMAFLDRKREQFWQALFADPLDFLPRLGNRFLAATLWYVPADQAMEPKQSWMVLLVRILHPLPFLALLFLLFASRWRPLGVAQRSVVAMYLVYLLPYVVISYAERYAVPLLGIKVLLVLWAAEWLWHRDKKDVARPPLSGKHIGIPEHSMIET